MHLRLSGYQGASSVHTRGLHHLARRLSAAGSEVEIVEDVTASGATAKALFEHVEQEEAHICYMASGYLTTRVPSLAVLDLPLTVSDRLRAHRALDEEAGRLLAEDVERMTGLHVLGFWDNGMRHISNRSRPIRSVEDCSGLVIRTLDNQLYQNTLAAFGFKPVVTDVRDLVKAVASGAVDAQENPLTNTLNFGLHEHHRFLSMTGHIFGVALLICRASWFRSLPDQEASALTSAARAATLAQRGFAIEEDQTALSRLRAQGVQVVERQDLDMRSFEAAAAPLISNVLATIDEHLALAYLGESRVLSVPE
ncbi:TRAP transporter substrate-binding protein [Microvirga lenta]|uniref:TRAP transporter substrate-binding protein n=1 Tax=Microvirga lenta TaxID=2881337 RepID=UPI001CFFB9B2|nr:TRAP transporter substrate-binding protein [Microvirga lenta]MCB5177427.1 TRAP transporter substrate-binding protein [Microvirga lenta]